MTRGWRTNRGGSGRVLFTAGRLRPKNWLFIWSFMVVLAASIDVEAIFASCETEGLHGGYECACFVGTNSHSLMNMYRRFRWNCCLYCQIYIYQFLRRHFPGGICFLDSCFSDLVIIVNHCNLKGPMLLEAIKTSLVWGFSKCFWQLMFYYINIYWTYFTVQRIFDVHDFPEGVPILP
jgi:hypothetical protein